MSHQHSASIWEIITALASAFMGVSALIAAVSYKVSRKSQYLSTIESCSKEYRDYMRLIQKGGDLPTIKRDILGLFHKQLFYIRNHYVPVNIKIEWLKTMHKVVSENGLNEDKGLIFKEEFKPKDWENSFHRVREFMSKKEKDNTNKAVFKFYKRRYFTLFQRVCLLWNSQWRESFPKET